MVTFVPSVTFLSSSKSIVGLFSDLILLLIEINLFFISATLALELIIKLKISPLLLLISLLFPEKESIKSFSEKKFLKSSPIEKKTDDSISPNPSLIFTIKLLRLILELLSSSKTDRVSLIMSAFSDT